MRLTDAYACFGAKARNPRRPSWSARSDDGQTVVLAMEHDLNRDGETVTIDLFGWMGAGPPRRGNKERVENLIHARDHLDSLFELSLSRRRTPDAPPGKRRIAKGKAKPAPDLVMRLIELKERTGEFRAQRAGAPPPPD